MRIAIEIESCVSCPHFTKTNFWSTDGWDKMEDWICKKHTENSAPTRNNKGDIISNGSVGKMIQSCVEWHEESKIKIPDWCPIKLD